MDQYTGTPLFFKDFEVYKEATREDKDNKIIYTIHGRLHKKRPEECPCCRYRKFVSKGPRKILLKHLCDQRLQINVEVEYTRWECAVCHACLRTKIPFKATHLRITEFCKNRIKNLLFYGGTTSRIAAETGVNRNIVKKIDKRRLEFMAGDMKPTHFSPFISVDEFSLHKHHEYATVVIDYCTGESLFVTQGKTAGQMIEFFRFVGHKFMENVVAVSMDMNASYAKAFKEIYPHIKIVYDGFHIIKNYNDIVLTEIRLSEQRRLTEAMNEALEAGNRSLYKELQDEYKFFKGSRYLILSNKKTLELKDAASCEHNRFLYEKYEKKGLKLPIGKHYYPARSIERLNEVLSANEKLQTSYYLGEMLKASLHCRNPEIFERDFKKWLFMARKLAMKSFLNSAT